MAVNMSGITKKKPTLFESKYFYIGLSLTAALATIGLKFSAWLFTGSVGLLSDALESLVNLAGALAALVAVWIASRPADESHPYGHQKVEYLSSAFEGGLILFAAVAIGWSAADRLFNPAPIESAGLGLAISGVATLINLGVGLALVRAGKRHESIALEADGRHLLTDVVTSIGVIGGVGLVALTGWLWLDPTVAILVALNILWEGGKIVKHSLDDLLDRALSKDETRQVRLQIEKVLAEIPVGLVTYHGLRTRRSGSVRFVDFHLLTPGSWSVNEAHEWVEQIESEIHRVFPAAEITIHVEPREDPRAYGDNWEDRQNAVRH
jgi:cation diffusion facilitator family transporter